jgi:hypothetical protein
MKKILCSFVMGAMLLSNVVVASAATIKDGGTKSSTSIVSVTDTTIFRPQTDDPDGW